MTEIDPQSVDEDVLALANSSNAVLITRDKGFGSLVFRQGLATNGVLLIRLAGIPMTERTSLLLRAVQDHGHEFEGAFAVLSSRGLRIRRPPSSGAPSA